MRIIYIQNTPQRAKLKEMDFKVAYILLSVLLVSAVTFAQEPDNLPYPNSALRTFNAYTRGLFSVIEAAETLISKDLLALENYVTQLNAEVNIRGNIPAMLAKVNRAKNIGWQQIHIRIRSTIDLVLLKLRDTVRIIQRQYPRTPNVERILNDVLKVGFAGAYRVKRIEANISSRLDEIAANATNYVENLHEAALQHGPSGNGDVYENRYEQVLPQVYPYIDSDIYGGLRQINGVVENALGEQRYDLSRL